MAMTFFALAGCDSGTGTGTGTVKYVSTDSSNNRYTLEIDESGKRSAAQSGDKFKLTVELYNSGNYKIGLVYSGKIGAANASGTKVSLTLVINGGTIIIIIDGAEMEDISGDDIVDEDGDVIVPSPGVVIPVPVVKPPVTPPKPAYSLDGIWEQEGGGGFQITASGSTGVISAFGSLSALWADAKNKNYIKLGGQYLRNLKSTGNLTWSGETLTVATYASTPNVATGTSWGNSKFTMSADGQTLTETYTDSYGERTRTWIRSSHSLDGVWERSGGFRITVSGSAGVISAFGSVTAAGQNAIDKGYWTLNSQQWRNLTSTGNLTWSGQVLMVTFNTSSPNVATGTSWINATFTMSADGQTLTEKTADSGGTFTSTLTRKQ